MSLTSEMEGGEKVDENTSIISTSTSGGSRFLEVQ